MIEIRKYRQYDLKEGYVDYFKIVKKYWIGGSILMEIKAQLEYTFWEEVCFMSLEEAYEYSQNIPKQDRFRFTFSKNKEYTESIPLDTILQTHSEYLI